MAIIMYQNKEFVNVMKQDVLEIFSQNKAYSYEQKVCLLLKFAKFSLKYVFSINRLKVIVNTYLK